MAPLPASLISLLPRSLISSPTSTTDLDPRNPSELSPIAIHDLHHHLSKRAQTGDFGAGVKPANEINNVGFQVLFALIGVGMVLGSIWFFFWAKNGGFKWKKDDWDDYKSTVLRRKGPDGKTLSNATKSTRLGGGSVVHGGSYGNTETVSDGYTDETATSADPNEMREAEAGQRHGFGIRGGNGRKQRNESSSKHKDPELRQYRHEKAARVGGLNRAYDGTYHDYSNSSDISTQPLTQPKKTDKKAQDKRAKEAKRSEKKAHAAEEKARKEAEKASKKSKTPKATKQPEMAAAVVLAEPAGSSASRPVGAPASVPHPDALRAARRAAPSAAYSFISGDDTNTVYTGAYTAPSAPSEADNSYYSSYRPHAAAQSQPRDREARPASHSRHSSPRKQHRSSRQSPAASDIFSDGTQDTGTKSYPCYIPGLSAGSVGVSESVSQVGGRSERQGRESPRKGRDVMDGYRRGGVRGRRDSLSDSDS
ncbi:hypothetical protein BU16DRAFT_529264 [Lophium mytilinum]|uniref:Uncharacterized protein n=1 Tax=Lophium mytilinum TaxID=390894 RepID=A0A6A6QL24_9PEZI|nr:hypothetical protein BU16DRAFT_529264 [Lophium mytilinum]